MINEEIAITEPQGLGTVLGRGLKGVCPKCGKGKLFRKYLKPVEACAVCGERYGHIRADDGPAWLTILIVGHVVATILLTVVPGSRWPEWVSMTVWPLFAFILGLIILPRAKGFFIAVIWRTRCGVTDKQ